MNTPSREDGKPEIGGASESYILPTQQERSRATLERILDAAETLLAERLYEDITIAEIVERASCSVGAFYSRVRTKEALLAFLRDRLHRRTLERIADELSPAEWGNQPLAERARAICDVLLDTWRSNAGVLRAILVNARRDHDFRTHEARFEEALVATLTQLLLVEPHAIRHADPTRACRFAIRSLVAVLRDQIVFQADELDDAAARALVRDLSRMVHAWLHHAEG